MNMEDYSEYFELDEIEDIDIIANCKPDIRAIARVEFENNLLSSISYFLATGAIYDDEYDCINDEDYEDEVMEEKNITKKEFDEISQHALKWVIE